MLTISIDPVAFTVGRFDVRWYGIMAAIGVLALLTLMFREAKRLGIRRDLYSIFLWGIIGGLVGGRLAYVIYYWEDFVAHPRDIIGLSGLAQNGMVLGIVAAALIYMGATRMRFSELLQIGDAFAVGAPVGLAMGRIGCTLNGCCHGIAAPDLPWAVVYTNPQSAALLLDVPVHPTQVYHVLWNLIVFAIVWRLRGRLKPEGSLVFLYFCIHAAGDLALRFLRYDRTVVLWGLDIAQLVNLVALLMFVPWLIIRMRRFRKQALAAQVANEAQPGQSRGY
ncbi:MAG: prolipoprotein diacylglyceryl transferase [Chloroflexi bacterium]|nr:prolipoprotein diacylglyceryl transferase [Chloroflexota bacterium]